MEDSDKTKAQLLKEVRVLRQQVADLQNAALTCQLAEKTLQDNTEWYRALIENQGEGFGVVDLEERFTFVNPAAERIFGVESGMLVGQTLEAFTTREQFDFVRQQTYQRQTGVVSAYELDIIRPNGEKRNLLITATPQFDIEGQCTGTFGIFRDVTERQQAADALRQNEQWLAQIVDGSSVAMFVIDNEHRVTHWNKACEALTGTPASAVVGTQEQWRPFYASARPLLADLIVDAAPEAEIACYYDQKYQKSQLLPGAYEAEDAFGDMAGQDRVLFFTAAPLCDAMGNIFGAIETLQDITERRQAEQALRSNLLKTELLYNIARNLITIEDLPNLLQRILDAVTEALPSTYSLIILLDIETETITEILVGGPQEDLAVIDSYEEVMEGLSGIAIRERRPIVSTKDLADPRETGRTQARRERNRVGSLVVVPLQYQDKILGTLTALNRLDGANFTREDAEFMVAIASQAAIAIENARLYSQARQDARVRADLLREVNHRVSNNLASILGILYAEMDHASKTKNQTELVALERVIQRMDGFIQVHRMLSEAEWAPVQLCILAYRLISASLSALPSGRRIDLQVLPCNVTISPRQANNLALILNELTTNTIKHAISDLETGHIVVDVKCEEDEITLVYRDDGPGYPEAVLAQREHNLGMYLVFRLAKALNATVTLINDNGAMTIVRFPIEVDCED